MPDDFVRIGGSSIGGKGNGIVRVKEVVEWLKDDVASPAFASQVAVPTTAFIATDVFKEFIGQNGLGDAVKAAADGKADEFEAAKKRFLAGVFDDKVQRELVGLLKRMTKPLAVRSSSLLEDQKGWSFAGKYESVFIGNHGDLEARKQAFFDAIKQVYASCINPSAIAYRKKHGFIDEQEEMAVVVQEVVGSPYGKYYMPAMAGVAFSQNGYCWSKNIQKKDGLVRLVMGLGTRAVGRGYVRLFSPAIPEARPEGTEPNNIQKCSQKNVDVVDLETNSFKSVHFRELVTDGFNCYPGAQSMISLRDGSYVYRPVSNLWDSSHIPILTMDGVLSGPFMGLDVPKAMQWLMSSFEEKLGFAVDMEFAIDVDVAAGKASIYVLQTRPLSEGEDKKPRPIPDLPQEDVLFTVNKNLPTAFVGDIEYVVYVDEDVYGEWPANDRQSVARAIGKLGEVLSGTKFMLVGPGRWGSWNPQLGVPVNYSEISNSSMLVEVAKKKATYVPEVSFGSHFFQDLIEDDIAYLPLYPDQSGDVFNAMILRQESSFPKLMPDDYFRRYDKLIRVIHVPSIAGGKKAHAILNGEVGRAIVYIK